LITKAVQSSASKLQSESSSRPSNALAEFCTSLEERPGLAILDFAPVNQGTITFVTNYGHKLYSEDFLHQLDQSFGRETLTQLGIEPGPDPLDHHANPLLASRFLTSALNFTDESFDGALVWDSLEYLAPPLLEQVVEKLHRILRPGSYLLALFHADNQTEASLQEAPGSSASYRIQDGRTLMMTTRPRREFAQVFNNRMLERMFQDFESVKFFLTRDNLREVIVRK
jgi:SAM-dependent methyltransferase